MRRSTASTDAMLPLRGQTAQTLDGLTWRRLGVVLLFVACQSIFSWRLAVAASRNPGIGEFAVDVLRTFGAVTTLLIPPLVAGLAMYNRARVPAWVRVMLTLGVIGVVTWYAQRASELIQPIPGGNYVGLWVTNAGFVAMVVGLLVYMADADNAARTLEREELGRIELDRGLVEVRLQVTQAQIEPHFLFNTLANVRRLYQLDPTAARAMLQEFSSMLGAALSSMRDTQSSLGRELALALAYLSVQKIRMGERLEYAAEIPDAIRGAEFPPMMLPTLVENAIKHGLAPLPQGGRVRIAAEAVGGMLRVCVADTGRGLSESTGEGVGLANIESRLAANYGTTAKLELLQNSFDGVTAVIELPLRFPGSVIEDDGERVVA